MKITLPDYKKIASAVEKKKVEVTKEEIEKMKAEKERMEKERLRSDILDKITQQTELELPQHLIAAEQERMMQNLKGQVPQILGVSFEEYLKRLNKTEKEVSDSFLLEAQKKVKSFLVLKAIGEQEKIQATEEEIKKETARIMQGYPDMQNLDQNQLKEYTKEVICSEKTFQMLESLAK